jgi:hypothetical protein
MQQSGRKRIGGGFRRSLRFKWMASDTLTEQINAIKLEHNVVLVE